MAKHKQAKTETHIENENTDTEMLVSPNIIEEAPKSDDEKAQEIFGEHKIKLGKYRHLKMFSLLNHEQRIKWVNRNIK